MAGDVLAVVLLGREELFYAYDADLNGVVGFSSSGTCRFKVNGSVAEIRNALLPYFTEYTHLLSCSISSQRAS